MKDVQIAVTAEELEAEVIRSRLEAEGIPARIAPKSQIGMPASWSPGGLGFGVGSFSVRVPAVYGGVARSVLGTIEPPAPPVPATERRIRPRAHVIVRVVATVILLYWLIGTATWLAGALTQR